MNTDMKMEEDSCLVLLYEKWKSGHFGLELGNYWNPLYK